MESCPTAAQETSASSPMKGSLLAANSQDILFEG